MGQRDRRPLRRYPGALSGARGSCVAGEVSGVVEGRIFDLSDRTVARLVKRTANAAGLDPTRFAGHSLRAGFATTAARKGKGLDAIMRQTGHRSERVARGYIRHARLFDDNAATGLL